MKKIPLVGALFSHKLFQGYGFAVVVSVLLHVLLLALLSRDWSSDEALRIVPPRSIKASVVEIAQPKARPPEPKPVVDNSAQKARELAAQKRREEARRQAEIKRQKELALKKEQAAKEQAAAQERAQERKKKEEAARKERERQQRLAEESRKKKQQEALLRQQEQAQAAAAEQAEKEAAEVAYYSELLNNLIAQNWNRPPSARNNMVALVQLSLSPFGDLLEVRLLEGSGNDAYDRSVIQAIQRAAPFPELKKLERRVFDNNFRRVNFRFRPEDLVR
ncbi:cell envelope integrity protein TolA [Endozoicomonas sp. 4G]|uniref:cell envelope integrity protein TolA n=1 Tax=Endozoicomonas sp. 4G TaxID=2872754 RepID=UPI002078D02F|nr:cell envelope integrity protein TolA [Endozoicomonas sp. 4G]